MAEGSELLFSTPLLPLSVHPMVPQQQQLNYLCCTTQRWHGPVDTNGSSSSSSEFYLFPAVACLSLVPVWRAASVCVCMCVCRRMNWFRAPRLSRFLLFSQAQIHFSCLPIGSELHKTVLMQSKDEFQPQLFEAKH